MAMSSAAPNNIPCVEWGRRLADAVRVALAAGDFAEARRLAIEGDGQARDLAREYMYMFRGLGVTVRVLLGQLATGPTIASRAHGARIADQFAVELARLADAHLGEAPAVSADCTTPFEAGTRTSEEIERRFESAQVRAAEAVVAAIDAGDAPHALALLEIRESGQYIPLHDRLVRFMADSFAWALEHQGSVGLERFHLTSVEAMRRGFDKWETMPVHEFAWTTAFLLKQHMGEVTVTENTERYTFEQRLCGSGGRLRIGGAYEGSNALPFVETPGPLTFGEPRMPVYCSHCPMWNGVAPLRWYGHPHWVFERPARPDGGCTMHLYKNKDAAPAEYVLTLSRA